MSYLYRECANFLRKYVFNHSKPLSELKCQYKVPLPF